LKKDRNKVGNKSFFSSTKYKGISEIERKVDRILLENKDKLDKVNLRSFDAEKFSLKDKDGESVYFFRRNLREKLLKTNKNVEKIDKKPEKKKEKQMIFDIDNLHEIVKRVPKGKDEIRDKEDIDLPSTSPNLTDSKKKYKNHITFPDIYSVKTDEIGEDEAELLDKKIGEMPLATDADRDKIDRRKLKIDKSKKKKIFFKRKKSSEVEEVKGKEEEEKSKKLSSACTFRVENLPKTEKLDKDKFKFLDEKIKEPIATSDLGVLKREKKARTGQEIKKKEEDDVEAEETYILADDILPEEDHLDHVFFDETDGSFEGWSPEVPEEESEKISLPHPGRPEVEPEDFKKDSELELPKEALQTRSIRLKDLGFSENEWEELDFYPLWEPFAYVEIVREKESLDKRYFLVEIELTNKEQKILRFIMDTLDRLTVDVEELESKGEDKYLMEKVEQIIEDYEIELDDESKSKLFYYIEKTALGLGRINPLMKDPNIEDISCDGANIPIFLYHRQYGSLRSNIEFENEEELSAFVYKLAQKCGKHISIAEPMLDATMPDASRIQMTLSDEITAKGSTFTIRRFRENPFSPPDLVEFNTMSSEMIAYMWLAVENKINALIAGGSASGKTTALNALSLFIPQESKIVSIEETRELNLPHPNWIPGVARSGFGEIVADKMVGEIDLYDLMKAALRQRPEYILVGEIRGREAYVLFQAMATGHATYSTVHADSPQSLIYRLEGKPINIPRVMLQSLDIVSLFVITSVENKRVRRCRQIIEIIDIDPATKEILTNEVFRWDPIEDRFIYSGKSYILERIRAEKDLTMEEVTNEIKNRKKIIEWMNTKNIREFREVAKIVAQYIENPDEVMKRIKEDIS